MAQELRKTILRPRKVEFWRETKKHKKKRIWDDFHFFVCEPYRKYHLHFSAIEKKIIIFSFNSSGI